MWLSIAQACENCGAKIAVHITAKKPTEQELHDLRYSIGGMYCIQEHQVELSRGEIVIFELEE